MEEEDIEKAVLAYLRKKGLKFTELALQEEQHRLSSDASHSRSENDAARYFDGYGNLRSWAYNSLDSYRHELLLVLYPVFIHCFMDLVAQGYMQEARTFFHMFREDHEMMHLRDLQKLEGILSPSHLEEMELARLSRQNKVKIRLCQYSYELLVQYLHKTKSLAMLGVINQHINFEVTPGQPTSISDDSEAVSLVGTSQDLAREINQEELHWGVGLT
jgi:transcription initiation factor TFIID subunit 5